MVGIHLLFISCCLQYIYYYCSKNLQIQSIGEGGICSHKDRQTKFFGVQCIQNITTKKSRTVSSYSIFPQFHFSKFEGVVVSPPCGPNYPTIGLLWYTKIGTIEVCGVAAYVPPSTTVKLCTICTHCSIIVLISCGKLSSMMVTLCIN